MSAKRLKPKPLVIGDYEGFENTDLFGLSEYGERLANLVCNVEDPLVTILDGPWGSGKTIFAKQWAGLMRQRGASVIYFDAFANDHHEDALTPLAAQILSALPDKEGIEKLKSVTLEVGKSILPVAANLLIRAISGGIIAHADLRAATESAGKILSQNAGLVIEKTLEERLRAAGEENSTFEKFRKTLEEISKISSQAISGESFPLVFIVDELDRCRPIFAINLIERVKHLFSVPGVQFLLVAHLPQLEEAVRHCYGLGLGGRAKIYLEKFYDVKVVIPEGRINSPVGEYIQYLWKDIGINSIGDPRISELRFLCFENIVRIKKISFRTSEKILANIALAYSVVPHDINTHAGFMIEGLCIIRHFDYEFYSRICSGIATDLHNLENHLRRGDETNGAKRLSEMWNDIKSFFELERWSDHIGANDWVAEWMADCWTYSTHRTGGDGRHLSPKVIHFARLIDSISPT